MHRFFECKGALFVIFCSFLILTISVKGLKSDSDNNDYMNSVKLAKNHIPDDNYYYDDDSNNFEKNSTDLLDDGEDIDDLLDEDPENTMIDLNGTQLTDIIPPSNDNNKDEKSTDSTQNMKLLFIACGALIAVLSLILVIVLVSVFLKRRKIQQNSSKDSKMNNNLKKVPYAAVNQADQV
jgi:hypothetical protein